MSVENPFRGSPLPPVDRSSRYANRADESIRKLHEVLGPLLPGKPLENPPQEARLPIVNLPDFTKVAQK